MKIFKKLFITLLVAFLLINISACKKPKTAAFVPSQDYDEPVEFDDVLKRQNHDTVFEFPSALPPGDFEIELDQWGSYNISDIIDVFVDSKLTKSVWPSVRFDSKKSAFIVAPPSTAPLAPYEINGADYKCPYGWGLANQLFIAQFYDLQSGKKLDKPLVTIFEIKHDDAPIKAPFIEFRKSESGFPSYSWNAVPGAEKYHLMYVGSFGNGLPLTLNIIDTFTVSDKDVQIYNSHVLANMFYKEGFSISYIYLLAEKNGVFSPASNLIPVESFRGSIVYSFNISEINLFNPDIDTLPEYLPVEMCDGNSVLYPVTYDVENLTYRSLREVYGSNLGASESQYNTTYAVLPVKADGTVLVTYMMFSDYQAADFLDRLQARSEFVSSNKGKTGADATITVSKETEDTKETGTSDIRPFEFPIFASSALSEYLAINLLNGNSRIDISQFPEASDTNYLVDCFFEVYYQNPLILKVNGLAVSYDGNTLIVTFGQSKEEQSRKQKEIKDTVAKIIKEIITADMSDLEKEFAINDYLCTSAVYDDAALEYALAHDMIVDDSFRDSFTAYGILVNKVGVCASYAAAFKLLADAAGLQAVVVTGFLNGYLPHAWNRINLNGQWVSLDVTNNDDSDLSNTLLNLWDEVSGKILVEDDLYVMDHRLKEFRANTSEYEYYRYNNLFYTTDKIAAALSAGLDENGFITLRTKEDLTSEELDQILREIYFDSRFKGKQHIFDNVDIYFFIGCITLRNTKH